MCTIVLIKSCTCNNVLVFYFVFSLANITLAVSISDHTGGNSIDSVEIHTLGTNHTWSLFCTINPKHNGFRQPWKGKWICFFHCRYLQLSFLNRWFLNCRATQMRDFFTNMIPFQKAKNVLFICFLCMNYIKYVETVFLSRIIFCDSGTDWLNQQCKHGF